MAAPLLLTNNLTSRGDDRSTCSSNPFFWGSLLTWWSDFSFQIIFFLWWKNLQTDQSADFIAFPSSVFSSPLFFNVAFSFKLPYSNNAHHLIFIASIFKLSLQIALTLLYSSTLFKSSKDSSNLVPSPGYVSVSASSYRNGLCDFPLQLHLLP